MSASIPKDVCKNMSNCMPGHIIQQLEGCRNTWKVLTRDPWVLDTIKGHLIDFTSKPCQDVVPHTPHSLHSRSGSLDKGRVKKTPEQMSSSRGNKPSERVLLKSLPGPKKGRRAETCKKPKVPEQFRSDTTLQDGGNPHFEGPDTTWRLVGKNWI